jgi:HSP20 family protein
MTGYKIGKVNFYQALSAAAPLRLNGISIAMFRSTAHRGWAVAPHPEGLDRAILEVFTMANKPTEPISFPLHLSREVERLFDEMIHRPWGFCREIRGWNPSVDLYETDDALILEADLPGVKADDVKVKIENGDLVLQGWRTLEESQRHGQFYTMERSSGHFVRRMKLPESVDKESIQAEFHDGVLRVTIPKAKHRGEESK